jgi:uncharacterized protein (DUF983 family)
MALADQANTSALFATFIIVAIICMIVGVKLGNVKNNDRVSQIGMLLFFVGMIMFGTTIYIGVNAVLTYLSVLF